MLLGGDALVPSRNYRAGNHGRSRIYLSEYRAYDGQIGEIQISDPSALQRNGRESSWWWRGRIGPSHIGHRHGVVVLDLNPVDIGDNAAARDRPTLRKKWDDTRVKILMYTRCARVILEGIGEQRQGELLRRSGAAVAPGKTRRRMFAQVKAEIEGPLFRPFADRHSDWRLAVIEALSHDHLPDC